MWGEEGLTRRVKAEVITSKGFATSVFDLLHNSDLVCGDCVVQSQVQIEIHGGGGCLQGRITDRLNTAKVCVGSSQTYNIGTSSSSSSIS